MALSNLPTIMHFVHEQHLLSNYARHLLADGIPDVILSAYRSWSAKTPWIYSRPPYYRSHCASNGWRSMKRSATFARFRQSRMKRSLRLWKKIAQAILAEMEKVVN